MIYYFSGTGNSEYIARELAAKTGDSAAAITKTNPEKAPLVPGGCLGLVFPVYAWNVPRPVREFAAHLAVPEGCYVFAVCTCGSEAGKTIKSLAKLIELDSAYSLAMPSNYLCGEMDTSQEIGRKLNNAKQAVESIAADIMQRKKGFDVNEGSAAAIKTGIVSPLFEKYSVNPKNFTVGEECTGCGLCERVCPLGNIQLEGTKPVWGANCVQCMGCINRCPNVAIEFGKSTVGKERYYFGKSF